MKGNILGQLGKGVNFIKGLIEDSLNYNGNDKMLSARQGKVLNDKINKGAKIATCTGVGRNFIYKDDAFPVDQFSKIILDKLLVNNSEFSVGPSGGITCPYAGTVLVSASIHFSRRYGYSAVGIYKNNEFQYSHNEPAGIQKWGTISVANIAINVKAGDTICLFGNPGSPEESDGVVLVKPIAFDDPRTRLTITYANIDD